jgi:hypothetical protein
MELSKSQYTAILDVCGEIDHLTALGVEPRVQTHDVAAIALKLQNAGLNLLVELAKPQLQNAPA